MKKPYKKYLNHNESLDELVERIANKNSLEILMRDLILGDLDELLDYNYFSVDKLSSFHEQANKWLTNVPFYIINTCRQVFDNIFSEALENRDWKNVRLIIGFTNKNHNGISVRMFEKLPSNLPAKIEIEILMTLLKFHKEMQDVEFMDAYWSKRIDLKSKPYLGVVSLSVRSKSDPLMALDQLKYFHDKIDVLDSDVRLLFQNKFKEIIINHFDIVNSNPSVLKLKAEELYSWFKTVPTGALTEMIYDVLHFSRLNSIKEVIQTYSQDMLIDFAEKLPTQQDYDSRLSEGTQRWRSLEKTVGN